MDINDTLFTHEESEYLPYIPTVANDLSYNEFFKSYLIKNQACVVKNVASNWGCYLTWSQNNSPCFPHLRSEYGEFEVTIYDCQEKYYNSQKTTSCKFLEYIAYWEDLIKCNYSKEKPLLYLKDWHLRNSSVASFYEVPKYFSSDWLNEYLCDISEDDYRFVYMGPKGTWTPFHADVFSSYSWSVNVCGQKRWLLFPPGEEVFLKDNLGNLPYDISHLKHNQRYFEVVQEQGDAIFVPSGWHHQVFNLTDAISINHNWINACNLHAVFEAMVNNLGLAKKEIDDCCDMDDFAGHCQTMLRASFGMHFQKFYEFIKHIAVKRLKSVPLLDDSNLGKNHALYDLASIKYALIELLKQTDFRDLNNMEGTSPTPDELLIEIHNKLTNKS